MPFKPTLERDLRQGYSKVGTPGFGLETKSRSDIMAARKAAEQAAVRKAAKPKNGNGNGGFKKSTGGFAGGRATGGFK